MSQGRAQCPTPGRDDRDGVTGFAARRVAGERGGTERVPARGAVRSGQIPPYPIAGGLESLGKFRVGSC